MVSLSDFRSFRIKRLLTLPSLLSLPFRVMGGFFCHRISIFLGWCILDKMVPLYAPPHSRRNDTQSAHTLTPSVIMISGNYHEGKLEGGRFAVVNQQFLRGFSLQKCY